MSVLRATWSREQWVRPERHNAARVLDALRLFGAPTSDLNVTDFERPDVVLQIGVPPRRIDVITSIDGVDFDEAWPRRQEVDVEGIPVPVIGREDLIRNKEASGRPRDMSDLEGLRNANESDWT